MKVLVTGSNGSLARTVRPLLESQGHWVIGYDLPDWNILDLDALARFKRHTDVCIHLAGLKYADAGEVYPEETVEVNVTGTANVAKVFGDAMVLASTCKAADPETVYGCSKLIAERIALAACGRVVRLVNVLGSDGSVTDIWGRIPADEPLPVCPASRLFIPPEVAASLMVRAVNWPTGRYGPDGPVERWMPDVAATLYPNREQVQIPLRRGDRQRERLFAACEWSQPFSPGVVRIIGQHDPHEEENLDRAFASDLRG